MYPSSQPQQVFLGTQQQPPVAPGVVVNPTIPEEKRLWGSNVRRSMGVIQIICGGFELALGIAVTALRSSYDNIDYAGWGLWTGLFAIVTGFLGVFSLTKSCMVIAYMLTSVIAALLGGGCFVYAIFGTLVTRFGANLALYIIMCIIFLVHMVISIIGASFTCGALSFATPATETSKQVVSYTPQPSNQQYIPTAPYPVTAQGGITY